MNMPTAYAGADKYIFISYSHRDSARVFPIIEKLVSNGYRVWFDEGIDPGSEWDEDIAGHIQECGYFIAFISKNYINSNNCKDELNYARDREKERLLVYLEDVELPSGMAMRLNRIQSIFKHTYPSEEDFYTKLFSAKNINICHGEDAAAKASEPDAPAQQTHSDPVTKKVEETIRAGAEKIIEEPLSAWSPNNNGQKSPSGGKTDSGKVLSIVAFIFSLIFMGVGLFHAIAAIVTAILAFMAIGYGAKKLHFGLSIAAIVLACLTFIMSFFGLFGGFGWVIIIAGVAGIIWYRKKKKAN
ncbi:MAG: toll/interleukin-1 receptor domain-containing protein [Clostridia bacterium]|nr:toll/interleukin-1 receptor domain-containing protein [Clostridia bacterium]